MTRVGTVVSGGQTGADRAALDAAAHVGLPRAGWCPAGGWAEDRPEPPGLLDDYPELRETPDRDPSVRTWWNVRDSDATLVLRLGSGASPGTEQTLAVARRLGRPHLDCGARDLERAAAWLAAQPDGLTLNVAGPRESEEPGLYAAARALLDALLSGAAAATPASGRRP